MRHAESCSSGDLTRDWLKKDPWCLSKCLCSCKSSYPLIPTVSKGWAAESGARAALIWTVLGLVRISRHIIYTTSCMQRTEWEKSRTNHPVLTLIFSTDPINGRRNTAIGSERLDPSTALSLSTRCFFQSCDNRDRRH
jgi:hypothetical protein